MPSPFPGMDPYLEGTEWTTFHAHFAVEIARQLAPKLAPHYVARAEKRYDVILTEEDDEEKVIVPDVAIRGSAGRPTPASVGSSVLTPAPLVFTRAVPEEIPHLWVEIRDPKKKKLITVIEFLSPTNKIGSGREQYLKRQAEILNSPVHLLEIDLIRRGKRLPLKQRLPSAPYFVFLSRVKDRPKVEVWPIAFDQPLPTVPVPLAGKDQDVSLDLQQAHDEVFNVFRFDLDFDYAQPPDVPLPPEVEPWAQKVLRKAKKR